MPNSFGAKPDRNFGLGRIDRFDRVPKVGTYPKSGSGAGQYGGTAYPSVIEAYNRNSDYKRWKLGQELYFGIGRNWASLQIRSLARFFNSLDGDDELDANGSKEVVTLFPSSTSSEGAWYCSTRTRGSLMLPQPIQAAQVTLDTSSDDPSEHRLILDCSSYYSSNQLRVYGSFVGDQFEDTASGPTYPTDLVPRPLGSLALTLVGINLGEKKLVFDLSKPYRRVERGRNIYWQRTEYDPASPQVFDTSGTRHLCSSFKFFCCCPDHLGGALSNLEKFGGSLQDRFPLPNASREVNSAWEREGAGYYRQWRSLPDRRDERRDCKHIHCMRWECGVPWLEPGDYPTEGDRGRLAMALEREGGINSEEAAAYFTRGQLNWDRYILTLADTVGVVVFPGGDVREQVRPDFRPMLWNDGREPNPDWCRMNDWWLERGAAGLRIFNAGSQAFRETVTKGGVDYPVLQFLDAGDVGAPAIIR
jgi:hypothetical protein